MSVRNGGYPSLEDVMSVVRLYQNDWQPGLTGTPGEGQISTDNATQSPQVLTALNSAIREVYRELRNVGSPSLIRDNVIVNLPANAVNGPNIQTYLSFSGYFDGQTLQPSPVLPPDMIYPERLWEQQTGNGLPFVPMQQPPSGLPSPMQQTFALGVWEWRGGGFIGSTQPTAGGDALWFVGALCPITIRMRYRAAFTQFFGITGATAFSNTFIPILDCEEAVGAKAAYKICRALTGMTPAVTDIKENAQEAMFQLRNAIARRAQTIPVNRCPYDECSTDNYSMGNDIA